MSSLAFGFHGRLRRSGHRGLPDFVVIKAVHLADLRLEVGAQFGRALCRSKLRHALAAADHLQQIRLLAFGQLVIRDYVFGHRFLSIVVPLRPSGAAG